MARTQILIVDDEARIRSSLAGILIDEGYEVVMANDGICAIEKLQGEGLPDVVLADIWMPGMDGLTLLKEIKNRNLDIPVIMISGHGTIETAVKAIKMGGF